MKRVNYFSVTHLQSVGFLVCFLFASMLSGQTAIERSISCQCIDNDAPDGSAQFLEELTVTSSTDEVWYIASVSGLYANPSPVPPADQVLFNVGPQGEQLVANGNQYSLQGIVIEDLDYSIAVTNGTDTLFMENVGCSYPKASIVGDNAICNGEIVTYSNPDYDPSFTYSWTIPGSKGTIISGGAGESLTVDWDEGATGFSSVYMSYIDPNGCGGTVFYTVEFEEDIYMACNDLNNHTVGPDCKVNVLPSDILEDMRFNDDSYQLTLKLASTGEMIPLGSDADNYLFQQIEVSIEHLCGENSCWGYIQLEDKYIPDLVCDNDTIRCDKGGSPEDLGFPVPNGVFVNKTGPNKYVLKNLDGCSDVELTYEDVEENYHCSTDFYKRVTRTWTAKDKYDNTTSCTEYIYYTRTSVDDVEFPKNYDGIDYQPLLCTSSFPKLPNGMPDPSFTGAPTTGVCGHLAIEYVDLPQQICESTVKLVRKWKVFDPCTNQNKIHNQVIKIMDNEKPLFYCPSDAIFKIENNSCTKDIQLPVPTDVTDCSSVTFTAKYFKLDETGNIDGPVTNVNPSNGQFNIKHLIAARYQVEYHATDDCGNTSSCSFYVTIKDGYAPVALCSSNSAVSLNDDGTANVPVSTFDGGSFDNCSNVTLLGKRLNDNCGPHTWGTHVQFCCADVGEVDIQLKAIDEAGNYSTCNVTVVIQDKKAPKIQCPPTQVLNCMDDKEDLSKYGSPIVTDNCAMDVEESVSYALNNCGTGFIYRNFKVVDAAGNEKSCTQTLQYLNSNPVQSTDITWPLDYQVDVCNTASLHPDSLPVQYGNPTFPSVVCSELGVNYYDNVYTNTGGFCKTIHRQWTINDKCSNAYFSHTQYIYISDDEKPVFDECSDKVLEVQALPNCTYQVYYKKEATDNCTSKNAIQYSYDIDLNNNGYLEIWKAGNLINQELPAGTHKVIWKAEDQCGNFKVCTEYITIKDQKAPTPYCINGISTVVMESAGSIEIWASDFNLNSTDNCSDKEDLIFSFSESPFNKNKVFTCEQLEGADEKLFSVDVYVHDESGNYDYCTTTIKVTSNGHCDGSTIEYFDMSGVVKTIDSELMPNVELTIKNIDNNKVVQAVTDNQGTYSFANLEGFESYELSATYPAGDPLNGVSTLDIVLIQKHILGIEKLNSADKIIAADVNNSGSITGSDIVQIRKLLLGLITEFPNNDAWRFVDAYADYPDPYKPFPVQDKVMATPLKEDMMQSDLISIKVGDVNLTRKMNFSNNNIDTRNTQISTLNYQSNVINGHTQFDFYIDESSDLEGLQFVMEVPRGTTLKHLTSESLNLNKDHYHYDERTNQLRFSWSGEKRIKSNDVLFSVSLNETTQDDIVLANSLLQNEIYLTVGSEIVTSGLALNRSSELENSIQSTELVLLDAKPNPFSDYVKIAFYNPFDAEVSLVLNDINGKPIHKEMKYFGKGNHEWNIDCSAIDVTGMLIYTLSTSSHTKSGKVLRIK